MKVLASRTGIVGMMTVTVVLLGVLAWRMWPRTGPQEYFEQGLAAIERSDWPAVLQSAEGLKGQTEFSGQQHLLRGIYLLKTNRAAAALSEFELLDPVGELREPALLYAGESLYRLDRLIDAQRLLATLVEEQPGHAGAHRWLAAIAYDLGDMNRAMDELNIVIRLDPSDYRPHLLQGQMQADLEQYRGAVEAYALAVAARPQAHVLEELLPAMARAQIQLRDYAAARQTLAQAERAADVLALDAECRLSLGDEPGARQQISEALDFDPQQPDALRLLGRLELDAGRPEAAIAAFQTVLDRDPEDNESRHQLSQALRLSGKPAEAIAQARRAARTIELKRQLATLTVDSIARPNDADVREKMAQLCHELGKNQLAETWKKAAAACRQRAAFSKRQSPAEEPPQ